jgi:hypothetical protein
MMTPNRKLYARASALPAIAAALALSSTPLVAQEAQPVTVAPPAPTTTTETPPAADTTPVTTDTVGAPETTAQQPAAETASPVTKTTKTVKRTTRIAAAKPAATMQTTTRTIATRAPAPAPAPAANPTPIQSAGPESAVAPVVDLNSKPATPPTTAAAQPQQKDDTLPIAAGGALALLALGGGAFALARRRRARDEELVEEEVIEHQPIETSAVESEPVENAAVAPGPVIHEEQPAIVAPSAFAWGNASNEPMHSSEPMVDEDDDRMPGESWVQRAYRGPTPNNPSVSLRARLKRAAFFDKREREVAAGTAEPVEMDAGLPDAMVDEQERELA